MAQTRRVTTRRQSASGQYVKQAARKGPNPLVIVCAIPVVVLVGAAVWAFVGPHDDKEYKEHKLKELQPGAALQEDQGDLRAAIATHGEIERLLQGDDRFDNPRRAAAANIKRLKEKIADDARVEAERRKAAERLRADADALLQEAVPDSVKEEGRCRIHIGRLKEKAEAGRSLPGVEDVVAKLLQFAKEVEDRLPIDWDRFKADLWARHKLSDATEGQFGPALKETRGVQPRVRQQDQAKLQEVVQNIEARAKDAIGPLTSRARKDDAPSAFLKTRRPQFEGTAAAEALEARIKEFEAKK